MHRVPALKAAEVALDGQAYGHYAQLSEAEIRELVVEDKWLATLSQAVQAELEEVRARYDLARAFTLFRLAMGA